MGVLVTLELEGDTDELLTATDELIRLVGPTPDGLLIRMIAKTDTGITVIHLWENDEARVANGQNSESRGLIEKSGLLTAAKARKSTVYPEVELRIPEL